MISRLKTIMGSKKNIFVIFLIILFLQVALRVFLYERTNWITPPGHVHTIPAVDAFYPAVMRQAMLGSNTFSYSYTTLPTPNIYSYFFFIGAGKIAALSHIDPVVMYEITRITGGIAILITTYWLIILLFPLALQVPAMIFTMLLETGPTWDNLTHTPIWQWMTPWFVPSLLDRHFYLPHHLWGEALGLALLCVIIRNIQKPSRLGPLLIIFLAISSSLTSPTFGVILVPCVFLPWLGYALVTKSLKKTFLPIAFATAGIGCASLFTELQFSAGPPWNIFTSTEKTWWTTNSILIPFIQSFSLFYPFIALLLVLIPFTWNKWSPMMRRIFVLAFCWSVLPFGLILLAAVPWIPLSNGRIATDLSTVPAGILATLVFYAAEHLRWFKRPVKFILYGFFLLSIGVSLLLSVIYFKQTIQNQNTEVSNAGDSWIEYPTMNIWNSIIALKNIPTGSHILENPRIATILPTYVPVHVYQGSNGGPDWSYLRGLSYVFYTGEMSLQDIRKLFTDNNITYVYYGPEEKTALKTDSFYPDLLDPIYTNPEVTIYKVRP